LDYSQKAERIMELVGKEKNLLVPNDGDLNWYVRQDLEELLTNINEFLCEKPVDKSILSCVDPLITSGKKCEKRDDPIYQSKILILGNVPIRAYAASCLVRLVWHSPNSESISMINSLAEDSNGYVREAVCRELDYFFEVNPQNCLLIAKKYCFDNKFVRWYLRRFLNFIVCKDRKQALEFFAAIIEKYGKKDLDGQGEDVLLRHAVDVIIQLSLLLNDGEYLKLFEVMVTTSGYNMNVRKQIVFSMTKPAFTSNHKVAVEIINNYLRLLTTFPELKPEIEFHPLHQLIQRNTSLLPIISPLLDELSTIKCDKPSLNIGDTYHFTIIDYIQKFFNEFQESATVYFLRVISLNEFLTRSFKVSTIIRVLEKIFDSNVDLSLKREAKLVLDKVDKRIYWKAENLADKVKDL
jgi:hypothetical protein